MLGLGGSIFHARESAGLFLLSRAPEKPSIALTPDKAGNVIPACDGALVTRSLPTDCDARNGLADRRSCVAASSPRSNDIADALAEGARVPLGFMKSSPRSNAIADTPVESARGRGLACRVGGFTGGRVHNGDNLCIPLRVDGSISSLSSRAWSSTPSRIEVLGLVNKLLSVFARNSCVHGVEFIRIELDCDSCVALASARARWRPGLGTPFADVGFDG
jgi:hypothetical protein